MTRAKSHARLLPCGGKRALSLAETMVTVGILAILIGVSAAAISGGRRARALAGCVSNLHSVGIAFNYYLLDYKEVYPSPTTTAQWEELLRPYVQRSVFRCPADNELFSALGSSYDWRDTGDPATTIAGVVAGRTRTDACLAYDSFPGWHAQGKVQVDYSQELMKQTDFFQDLQRPAIRP